MNAIPDFTLTFSVAGPGVSIAPATGAISIAAGKLQDGIEVAVSAAPDGTATGRYRLAFQAIVAPPRLVAAPVLAGPAVIGTAAEVDPGSWEAASSLALQWCRDGADIPGATAASYTPVAADDRTRLACRVIASNTAGSTTAETAAVEVIHAAPRPTGTLADLELELDSGSAAVEAAPAFAGAGLGYAVDGAGATIDPATGRVAIPTDALVEGASVTVTASNSGGSASAGFEVSVRGVAPAVTSQPKLSGGAKVGAAVSVDPGSWSGKPAPSLALQWRRDGTAIAGATAVSYVPVAADDRTELTCRVTASNAVGSLAATTAALAVTRVAPSVTGALADLELELESGPRAVEAAPAFTGGGLGYAVTGAGATIDPASGRISIPTDALRTGASVTVTASNSGGSASAGFKVSVRGVAPAVVSQPKLSGGAEVGSAVSVDPGSWSGKPTPALALQWRRDGTAIAGATAASYVPVAADERSELTCRVTATNVAGSASATSNAVTITAAAQAPVNTVAPGISGTAVEGETLTGNTGTWTGNPTPAFARNWQRGGSNISGATGNTYALQAADVGEQIRLRVIGTNSAGSATAFSPAVSVGAASGDWAIVTVNPGNYLSRLTQARSRRTRYMFEPGVYPDFYWPTNVNDYEVEVLPTDRNNPPTIRALAFGRTGRNFSHLSDAPAGSVFRRMKLDGLNFIAQRFTSAGNVSLILPDGQGLGWRIQGTSHPAAGMVGGKESGSYLGLDFNTGSDIEVCNCLFDGYAIQLGFSGSCSDIHVHHNQFRNLPEDGLKFACDRIRIEWNEWYFMRGPTEPMSQFSGGPNPPHPDCIQQMAPADDVTIENNVMIDDHLAHGGLVRNAAASGNSHRVSIRGNEIRVKSFTGFGIDDIERDGGSGIGGSNIDLRVTGNKVWSGNVPGTDGGPMFGAWGGLPSWHDARLQITNNIAPKLWLGGIAGNTQSNSGSLWPSGWVEKARDRVAKGQPFAGRYGATAGVIP